MKLTPEQLLQPRYEVIAPYPLMPYNVGDLLHRKNSNSTLYEIMNVSDVVYFDEEDIANHPNLFRKLEWWEKRSWDDLPDYFKRQYEGKWFFYEKVITEKYIYYKGIPDGSQNLLHHLKCGLPATLQEYTDYQNYLNQTK